MLVITGNMNVASRMDAYVTNMKMPFGKEENHLLSVGSVEVWNIAKNTENLGENEFIKYS